MVTNGLVVTARPESVPCVIYYKSHAQRGACKMRNAEYGITEYGIKFILYLTHTTRTS